MSYTVSIKSKAVKALEKINEPDYTAIKNAINNLATDPRPHGCKKLKGRDGYRVRAGDYGIIYNILSKDIMKLKRLILL